MKIVGFADSIGGTGKTTLVYHLAWMLADMGHIVIAADLDPQANLTSMFLDENRLEELWPDGEHRDTIYGVIEPILRGTGDIRAPQVNEIDTETGRDAGDLGLISGDPGLSGFADGLSEAWPRCQIGDESAFRTMTAFYRAILMAAAQRSAELVLIDVGPGFGAINRAALIACQYVVIPVVSDLFSLQGMRNLGPKLRSWRETWSELRGKSPDRDMPLPSGEMCPVGYVVTQHAARADRAKAYLRWMERIPNEYRQSVANEPPDVDVHVENDPYCLAALKHYRSLMPLAMEARKPMFRLKPADGAIGAHVQAVQDCYYDFRALAGKILSAIGA